MSLSSLLLSCDSFKDWANDVEQVGSYLTRQRRLKKNHIGLYIDHRRNYPSLLSIIYGVLYSGSDVTLLNINEHQHTRESYDIVFSDSVEFVESRKKYYGNASVIIVGQTTNVKSGYLQYEKILGTTKKTQVSTENTGTLRLCDNHNNALVFTQNELVRVVNTFMKLITSENQVIYIDPSSVFDCFIFATCAFLRRPAKVLIGKQRNEGGDITVAIVDSQIFDNEMPTLLSKNRPLSTVIVLPGVTPFDLTLYSETPWVWDSPFSERKSIVFLPFTYWLFKQKNVVKPICNRTAGVGIYIAPLDCYGYPIPGTSEDSLHQNPMQFGEICLSSAYLPKTYYTGVTGYLSQVEGEVCIVPFYPTRAIVRLVHDGNSNLTNLDTLEHRVSKLPHVNAVCILRGVGFLRAMVVLDDSSVVDETSVIQQWRRALQIPQLEFQVVKDLPATDPVRDWACRSYVYKRIGIPTLRKTLTEGKVSNAGSFVEMTNEDSIILLGVDDISVRDDIESTPPQHWSQNMLRKKLSQTEVELETTKENLQQVVSAAHQSVVVFDAKESRLQHVVEHNLKLETKVANLELELAQSRKDLALATENKRILAQQLSDSRAEVQLHRTWREQYEQAMEKQIYAQKQAEFKLEQVQKQRAREVEGKWFRSCKLSVEDQHVMTKDLADLLRVTEFELTQTQQINQKYSEDVERQRAQIQLLRQRIAELESNCRTLELENQVAVDFLVRLEANTQYPVGSDADHEVPSSSTISGVVRDVATVKEHVDYLRKLFEDRKINFPLHHQGDRLYTLRHRDEEDEKIVRLAIEGGRVVVENERGTSPTPLDLLEFLLKSPQ